MTLERFGYLADVAGNGVETLNAMRRQPYDVILMDIQMPEMQPRIIAMTANAMQGTGKCACPRAWMITSVSGLKPGDW